MTEEQLYKLQQYKDDADNAYNQLDDVKIDYDNFAQIAEASSLKATQSKLIYDGLYNKFIAYPTFLKNLNNIYLDAKAESDADQVILKEKLDAVNSYKLNYDNVLNKISEFQTQIDIEDLGNELQNIANNPNNLRFSYELVAAKDSADYAKKVADDLAAQAAAQASIGKINGIETCISKITGKDIGMDKCRATSSGSAGSGSSSVGAKNTPTAKEISEKKVDDWIKIANDAIKPPIPTPIPQLELPTTPKTEPSAPSSTSVSIPTAEKTPTPPSPIPSIPPTQDSAEKLYNTLPDTTSVNTSSLNSLEFNVDLSLLTNDLNRARAQGYPSQRQQNIIYTLCSVSNGKIVTPESKLTNGMLWNQYVYQFSVTDEEIAIARAYCPNSEIAINFYDNEKINFYDPYPYGSFNFNIKIFSDKEPINFKIQDQVNIIDLSPLSSYYMWGKISEIYKDTNYGWNIVVSIYGLAGTPPPSINNPNWNNGISKKWQLVKDTSNIDFNKLAEDENTFKTYRRPDSVPVNIKYKGNWNQYENYYVNDLVNFGNYSYLITRDIPNSLYYYHPDQGELGGYTKIIGDILHPETGWRQQYINNAYCSIKNGILLDSQYGYKKNNNGISWDTFVTKYKVKSEEETIARASCKDSELSTSYYKKIKSFDGSMVESNPNFNLNNTLILLAGVSAIFLVHNILKNK